MKKILTYCLLINVIISCDLSKNAVKRDLNYIKSEFSGLVEEKILCNRAQLIRIKTINGDCITTPSVTSILFDSINLGDSIVKIANSNYCIIHSIDGVSDSLCYVYLSFEHRQHKLWPEEWKKKWMNCATSRAISKLQI